VNKTPIEWTDFTINPFRFRNLETGRVGHYCEKISPGCKQCYSGKMQLGPYLSGLDFLPENFAKGELFLDPKPLEQVLARKKPCRIFWCDMTDMFLAQYPDEWIDKCIGVMARTPHITHQVLTKRPDRMVRKMFDDRGHHQPWPLPNVILGASVEDQQRADERHPYMREIAAAGWNTFVSYEPALGPVNWLGWEFLKWGIVGGESGPGARSFDLAWARSAVEQWRASGTAAFVKQLGSTPRVWSCRDESCTHPGCGFDSVDLKHPKGGDMSEWPADLQFVREFPVCKSA
jgi:protein gp37